MSGSCSPVFLCFSGKRRSGKDFVSFRLQKLLDARGIQAVVKGISYSLKEEYAKEHELDAEKLKFDLDYKELVRKSMVEYGESVRLADPVYFCRKAVESIDELNRYRFVIISDCRRHTDLGYFRQNYRCCFIRIRCEYGVRVRRGFVYVPGIDDQETECALDSFDGWDKCIDNSGDLELLDRQLEELVGTF